MTFVTLNQKSEEKRCEAVLLDGISKTFKVKGKTIEAVKDVTLSIARGEIFGIIGFSGAGKSTLVRCINLLEKPTAGRVVVNGTELTALTEKALREERRNIGMIFQNFNLMPSRTASENIALALKLSDLSEEDKKKRIHELLELVGLSDRADSYPSQLSGGQKQRVAIARALANSPEVLLCDEATSALDPQTTRSILQLLLRINRELDITIIVITHQMSVIKDICDRVAVMEHGRVVEEGNVVDVFASPKAEITRGFIETAENLTVFYEKLSEGSIPGITEDSDVWFLTFTGSAAGEAVVTDITKRFDISANIVYGTIDFLKNATLGKLAIGVRGNKENKESARAFLIEKGIRVEVLK